MKLKVMPLGFLGFLSGSVLSGMSGVIAPASAQCVMTDVSVQVAVRGSHRPANQQNNVDMQDSGHCRGSATTQTGTQVYAGSADEVNQIRNSHQSTGDGDGRGPGGPTIKVPVGVKVDVYNPAYDPAFMNRVGR
jgi:hypothetical protein